MPYQVDWVIEDDNDTFESGTSMLELIAKDHGLICTHSGIWLLGTKKRDMEFELKSDTGESDQEVMDRIEQIEAAFEKLKTDGLLIDFSWFWSDDYDDEEED